MRVLGTIALASTISICTACRTPEPNPIRPGPVTANPESNAPGTHSPVPEATNMSGTAGAGGPGRESTAKEPPKDEKPLDPPSLEIFATLESPMPESIAVSGEHRVFVSFPRRGENAPSSVAEMKGGFPQPYPPPAQGQPFSDPFASAESVTVDERDRLWILDAKAAKLFRIDLASDRIVQTISLGTPSELEEVRVDAARGKAVISDHGANALLVVDLATGKVRRRLADHYSMKPELSFEAKLKSTAGAVLRVRDPGIPAHAFQGGVDGLAIAGEYLYYSPLTSRTLYRLDFDALCDARKSDAEIAKTIVSFDKQFPSESMVADARGRIYLTDWEHGAIDRFDPADQSFETIITGEKIRWPDGIALAPDGYLYFVSSQLDGLPKFHGGHEMRIQPYFIHRTRTDSTPPARDEARPS